MSAVRFVSADHTQETEVVIANGKNEGDNKANLKLE